MWHYLHSVHACLKFHSTYQCSSTLFPAKVKLGQMKGDWLLSTQTSLFGAGERKRNYGPRITRPMLKSPAETGKGRVQPLPPQNEKTHLKM